MPVGIPTKIIKLNKHVITPFKSQNFISCIDKDVFPNDLKHAGIVPEHKKK